MISLGRDLKKPWMFTLNNGFLLHKAAIDDMKKGGILMLQKKRVLLLTRLHMWKEEPCFFLSVSFFSWTTNQTSISIAERWCSNGQIDCETSLGICPLPLPPPPITWLIISMALRKLAIDKHVTAALPWEKERERENPFSLCWTSSQFQSSPEFLCMCTLWCGILMESEC